jgi:hypothetical protein
MKKDLVSEALFLLYGLKSDRQDLIHRIEPDPDMRRYLKCLSLRGWYGKHLLELVIWLGNWREID